MCLIIDANFAHKFGNPSDEDVAPIVRWLKKPRSRANIVIGGKLRRELARSGQGFRDFVEELIQAGRFLDKDDGAVEAETEAVVKELDALNWEDADDPHIIALARVSGSRLLASHDSRSGLHAMFKDRRLLDPPGKVYQKPSHKKLLVAAPKCKACQD